LDSHVLAALGLTLFAGLSTGLGSLVVFFTRRPNLSLLSFGLGFSGGIMVYISLVELLPGASELMERSLAGKLGGWLSTGCFFGGMLISALIDRLVPDPDNPHQAVPAGDIELARRGSGADQLAPGSPTRLSALSRTGLITALVIGLHNFPEGIATFATALSDPTLGLSIAIAVAIHNVPEGVSVAVPVYFATRSRRRAFVYSFASGLAEPVGAFAAYLALRSFLDDTVVAGMLAAVAGIMVFISFDELLPAAREYGQGHTAIAGVGLGMAVMAVSLLLF
jgi:ZIP family zinc transporter